MKKMTRLVIDTNILVAATCNRLGPSFALVQAVRGGMVLMCCSPALFLEYEEVLKRGPQLQASGLEAADVGAILGELASWRVGEFAAAGANALPMEAAVA